jgi:CheY-like chemotaxis protein
MANDKQKCRVLVVDDHHDTAETLAVFLRMLGHDAYETSNPLEAVDLAGALRPNVILLDLTMPKVDGYQVARQIRGQPWGESITLVALSGRGEEADKQRTRESGFDYHLVKPANFDVLEQILTDTCGEGASDRRRTWSI